MNFATVLACRDKLKCIEGWLRWHLRNYAAAELADASPGHPIRRRLDEKNGEFEGNGRSSF